MQPLSNDLRKRILDAVDNKEGSRRKLAARFKVNPSAMQINVRNAPPNLRPVSMELPLGRRNPAKFEPRGIVYFRC